MYKIGGRSLQLKQQTNPATPLPFLRSCSDAYQISAFIKSQILYFKSFNQFQKRKCNFRILVLQYFSDLQSTAGNFFLFLEAQAIMMPIARAFSKARLKIISNLKPWEILYVFLRKLRFLLNNFWIVLFSDLTFPDAYRIVFAYFISFQFRKLILWCVE